MRYSVVLKFLALVLCAAMLCGILASGAAIFCLNEAGLYQQPYHQAYARYRGEILQNAAQGIVQRYAAAELGGLDAQMCSNFYGEEWYLRSFRFGTMGYVLRDPEGREVQTYTRTGEYPEQETVAVAVDPVPYPKLTAVYPTQTVQVPQTQPQQLEMVDTAAVFDTIPLEGAVVTHVSVSYGDSSEGIGSPDGLGILFHNGDGFAEFHGNTSDILDVSRRNEIISLRFENEVLGVLYEITDSRGVGLVWAEEDGKVRYLSNVSNPDFAENGKAAAREESPFIGAQVYDAPGEDANVIGTLGEEDGAHSFRQYEVDGEIWYLFAGGWVKGENVGFLPDTAAEEPTFAPEVVLPGDVPVYAVPNRDGEPLEILKAGTPLEVKRSVSVEGETWYLIPQGWILEASLDAQPEETPETSMPTEESGPAGTLSQPTEGSGPAGTLPQSTEAYEPSVSLPRSAEVTLPLPEQTADPVPVETVLQQSAAVTPGGEHMTYYDGLKQQTMVLEYTMEETGGYEVEFSLAKNALEGDFAWSLLGFAYRFRDYLVPVLLGSALLFALLAVYLCCAAGRSPRRDGVQAGGLNRIPLDGWLLLWLMGIMAAVALGMEGSTYLMRGSMAVGTAFAAALTYGGCLLTVCFCFACAAQFKTPGGFWWKKSLCGLILRGGKVCWVWARKGLCWMARILEQWIFPYALRLLRALWKFIRVMAVIGWDTLLRLRLWTGKQARRLWAGFLVFWQQLPMTWQWLLAGFAMIILLALTVSTRLSFWGICGAIALILYAAHAFGTLLGGVKRMNKGDLSNKVDDKLLIGCFREFAGELNGLADVAMVAAQKQLKSERMKTELITNVSHDIKTPLTSIINYVDLLEKPHSPEEQEAYLEVLNRQSQRLKKLVEDLMEMSKASTGNMSVDITCVDAVEAVNQALGEFGDKLDRAQLIPVFRHPEEPVLMQADGRLVWRVLSNLLGNAVKYALPGTRIYLDLNRAEDKVILSLKNISRQELNITADELLERFVRGDVSRNTEGSGLGLNIAKSLMELQKGSLQLLVDGDLFKVTLIFPAQE